MSLTLYFHPLSSFCQKALIAFYENDIPFTPHMVNLFDDASATAFRKIWPIGRFPVLRDEARDRTVPESSIIIEYLAALSGQHAARPRGWRRCPADAPARSLLRSLRQCACGQGSDRQAAAAG
jgi:glutathione S-transferase